MPTVHDPPARPRPCPHCGGHEVQTFGHGADAALYCMNPACGRPLAGPAPPWFPATDPAACRLCTRRWATHLVRTGWGPSGRCDSCYAAHHALRRRQRGQRTGSR
jgi:hypothetical protein